MIYAKQQLRSFVVLILLLILAIGSSTKDESNSENSRKTSEVVYNSPWDGSVRQVERFLKNSLKDPDSYQGIEWSQVVKSENGFLVRHKYRAKNSFGGYVVENRIFQMDRAGNVTSVTE